MNKSIDGTRVILIGGSSHVGKSTLGRSITEQFGGRYLSTDNLSRHPGRPWVNANKNYIPKQVAEHYRTLSIVAWYHSFLFAANLQLCLVLLA